MTARESTHIAHFASMVPNKRGPVELGLLEIGRAWTARGGRFSVFFLDAAPPWYARLLDEAGIEHGVVGHESWHADVLDRCARIRPDVVHLHMGRHTMARDLVRRGIVVLRTEHSQRPPRRLEPLRRVVRWYRQRPLAVFVCVSDYLAGQTRRDFLVRPHRIRVIHNGCDLARFRPRPEDERARLARELFGAQAHELVVTVAAHLAPLKQHHLVLRAWPRVSAAVPSARLVVAGDGSEREALHRLADELGVSSRVTFLHGDNDVAAIDAASHVGVLVSAIEGLGGSAVEAQATGLPLVATRVGGLPETFVDGVSGIGVDADPDAIADALIRLLHDAPLRERMGRAAREHAAATFAPALNVQRTLGLYDELLAEGR